VRCLEQEGGFDIIVPIGHHYVKAAAGEMLDGIENLGAELHLHIKLLQGLGQTM